MKIKDITAGKLNLLSESLNKIIVNASVNRVIEPDPEILGFETRFFKLILSVKPGFNFAGISKNIRHRSSCSAFCMLLRKYLTGAKITSFSMPRKNDRILIIKFNRKFNLICEFTGRHSNIFLTDENNKILGSLKHSSSVTRRLNAGTVYKLPPEKEKNDDEIVESIDIQEFTDKYIAAVKQYEEEKIKKSLNSYFSKKLKKVERALKAVKEDEVKLNERLGELRLGNLFLIVSYSWEKGAESVYLDPAPDGGSPVELHLPPKCSDPVSAAEYHFKRYKKAKRGLEFLKERKLKLQSDFNKIKVNLNKIKDGKYEEYLKYLKIPVSTRKKKNGQDKKREFREFISFDGLKIYVGRSDTENHKLTFKKAKGRDWWFHIRNLPGSHVIVETKKDFLPKETLIDAAMLAVFYSDAKKEGKGDVIYTRRKYLRAVKGAPGKVTVSSSKNIFVEIDKKRMDRLFDSVN